MAAQRFRSDVDRTRLAVGGTLVAIALLLTVWLVRVEIRAGRVSVTALVMLTLFAGLFYLGLRLLRPKDLFEIDVERRTYTVIRDGTKAGAGPLDDLGPLEVKTSIYRPADRPSATPLIQYMVCAAVHSQIDFCMVRSPGKARRKMEALARAWGVPSRSLGGAIRQPDQIDLPLHERLRDDADARKESPLPPESGIRIEPLSLGYAMHSTVRSWAPLHTSMVMLAIAIFLAARSSPLTFLREARASEDLIPQILLGGLGVVVLVFLCLTAAGVRDTFFPGTVRITDRGVSYRFSRMAFREIEELIASHPIELIGDRRTLKLGQTFGKPGAVKAVAHELQRLIIEVAEANPHAR
jgi:hypothetical protein